MSIVYVKRINAINANGEVLKTYKVNAASISQAKKIASAKVKVNFPNTYPFVELSYDGTEGIQIID